MLVGSNTVRVLMLDSCTDCMFDCMRSYNFNISMYVDKINLSECVNNDTIFKKCKFIYHFGILFSVQPVT